MAFLDVLLLSGDSAFGDPEAGDNWPPPFFRLSDTVARRDDLDVWQSWVTVFTPHNRRVRINTLMSLVWLNRLYHHRQPSENFETKGWLFVPRKKGNRSP